MLRTFCLLSLLVLSLAKIETLVLVDDADIESTHSAFFDSLRARGHNLKISESSENPRLGEFGKFEYDNLILFSPSAEDFGEHINTQTIVSFIDAGHNVLVAVNEHVTEPFRELASECGLDIDEDGSQVIDHANYDTSDDTKLHTLIAFNVPNIPSILGKGTTAPVLFRGVGHAAVENPALIYKILTGYETTFSHDPKKAVNDAPQSTGKATLLVTAIQARNNARIVFSGSLDLFSNKFFQSAVNLPSGKHAKSGNEQFSVEVSKWVFQERGLLRASKLTHYKQSEASLKNPAAYRIKDNIHFSILIEEFDGNKWVPFKNNDVQLEFVMLDPYIRQALKHDGKGTYALDFQVPDVYGVFKFVVRYQKLGYSNLEVSEVIPVHPFRHDQFERFIDVAYPYYASAFSLMGGFLLFGVVFLFASDEKPSRS